jgi:thiamine-monophosphate kinase
MMDVSDGLAKDLGRLCEASEVAASVVLAHIPIALSLKELAGVLPHVDPLALALEGGEDYELLATLPPGSVAPTASKLADRFGTQLTEIGEMREGRGLIAIEPDGTERPLEPKGWDHFGE